MIHWLQTTTGGLLTLAAVSIAVLLVLIIKVKVEPFIALIVVGVLTVSSQVVVVSHSHQSASFLWLSVVIEEVVAQLVRQPLAGRRHPLRGRW